MNALAAIGDVLGKCPDQIDLAPPVSANDIRSAIEDRFVGSETVASGYAEWLEQRYGGAWLVATEG